MLLSFFVPPFPRILVLLCVLCQVLGAAPTIEITQKESGRSLQVTPLAIEGGKVSFKVKGKRYKLALGELTEESATRLQAWHEESVKKTAGAANELNAVVGHELFGASGALWDESANEVAGRLKWRKESATENSSSFRSYPRVEYGFINAHPHCCTLYGHEEGKVSHFSLVYANKGDFGSTVGSGEDHFKPQGDLPTPKSLNEAIERDAKGIALALTGVLGEPVEQRYGEKEDRRKVKRWDFRDHAFILSEREDEYTHLLIVSGEMADNEGKIKFVKDQELRDLLVANVVHENNGDVRIKNIPMVDQGPKGYCAPATFERAMRYMLVPADMYLLATLATAPGGGTYTGLLAEESKRIIRSKARRIKDLDLKRDLSMRVVSSYIDKGVPILWQMASLEKYNEIANKRSEERLQIEDFEAWKETIASEAEAVLPGLHDDANHHICMIIGYNKATNELAVSDSWGPRYELRWVHLDIAKAVSTSGGFVVDL